MDMQSRHEHYLAYKTGGYARSRTDFYKAKRRLRNRGYTASSRQPNARTNWAVQLASLGSAGRTKQRQRRPQAAEEDSATSSAAAGAFVESCPQSCGISFVRSVTDRTCPPGTIATSAHGQGSAARGRLLPGWRPRTTWSASSNGSLPSTSTVVRPTWRASPTDRRTREPPPQSRRGRRRSGGGGAPSWPLRCCACCRQGKPSGLRCIPRSPWPS